MSLHSYSRCWLHLIWGSLNREKLLGKKAASRVSRYLSKYAETKGVYMKINYVNADHVHVLVDLPTGLSAEELMQLFKGSSSHWINANDLCARKFAWGRGYAAFSVSESNVDQVAAYICGTGGTSSNSDVQRRIQRIYRTPWIAMARCGKPLKRLLSITSVGNTGLKAGFNENIPARQRWLGRRGRLRSTASSAGNVNQRES